MPIIVVFLRSYIQRRAHKRKSNIFGDRIVIASGVSVRQANTPLSTPLSHCAFRSEFSPSSKIAPKVRTHPVKVGFIYGIHDDDALLTRKRAPRVKRVQQELPHDERLDLPHHQRGDPLGKRACVDFGARVQRHRQNTNRKARNGQAKLCATRFL